MTSAAEADNPWRSPERRAIGQALLAAGAAARTAPELAAATGRDPSNLRRAANGMVEEGLLVSEPAPSAGRRPGKQARIAYRLAEGEAERVAVALDESGAPGTLIDGLQVVLADASGQQLPSLLAVIAEPEAASQLTWSALIDGEPQEYLFAFEGPGARAAASALVAVLDAADIRSRRASIAGVASGHGFLAEARRATDTAKRVAIRQATRRIASA